MRPLWRCPGPPSPGGAAALRPGAPGRANGAWRGGGRGEAGGKREQRRAVRRPRSPPARAARRDAEDAVYGRDGYDYDGYRLRVEFPRSGRGTGRGGGGGGGGGAPRGRYGPPSRRSEYRVIVSGESLLSLSLSAPPGSCRRGAAASCSLKSIASCALGGEEWCSPMLSAPFLRTAFAAAGVNTGREAIIRF